jgi:GNAT superfamily N-acetyltransferase
MFRISERTGLSYLDDVTVLLQRVRQEHPTAGPWEAADLQWWWRLPRSTDNQLQVFWYDEHGPVASAVTTDWGSSTWLDLIVVPSVRYDLIRQVFDRGLEQSGARRSPVEMLVGDEDDVLIEVLEHAGFQPEQADTTAWMEAASAPDLTRLPDGYSLESRADNSSPDHPFELMTREVENRLSQTSLYRPELDLTVIDEHGHGAANALFWLDPSTGIGLIEPVGTSEAHRGRGLARHLISAGIQGLVAAGSERIKVSWELDNEPAAALYLASGFKPATTSSFWAAPKT